MKSSVHHVLLGLEDQSKINSRMHVKHPAVLLLTVLIWILFISSYGRHELIILLPYCLLIYDWLIESKIDKKLILNGLWKTEPFIIAIAMLNPIFEKGTFEVGGYTLPVGILTALNILIKGNMTIALTLCLMATLGISGLARALTYLKLPKLLIDTVVMTYRYLIRFTEEIQTRWTAYQLRVPEAKGIDLSAAGSFVGQLFIRSLERGELVHQAMALRGSTELPVYEAPKLKWKDLKFMLAWFGFSFIIKILSLWI